MILKKEDSLVIVLEGFCKSFDIFNMLALDRKLVGRGMKLADFLLVLPITPGKKERFDQSDMW